MRDNLKKKELKFDFGEIAVFLYVPASLHTAESAYREAHLSAAETRSPG